MKAANMQRAVWLSISFSFSILLSPANMCAAADTFECGVKAANEFAACQGDAKGGGDVAAAVAAVKLDEFDDDAARDAALAKIYGALLGGRRELAAGDKAALRDFLYSQAAGIQPGFKGGWDDFELFPAPDRRLGFVRASKDTAKGAIKSEWKYDEGKCVWSFTIPEGAKATVCVNGMCKRYKSGTYVLEIAK